MRPYDADADAWDDTALVRAYDDAIARHGAPSNAPTARRRGSNEDERANDAPTRSGDARREATPRSSERTRARASPVPHYYAETSYGDEYEYEYGRRAPPPPPPPRRGHDPYDAYGGYYAARDEDYGYFEDEFAAFSPFRRGRGPPRGPPPRGPPPRGPPSPGEYGGYPHRAPPMAPRGIRATPLRAPPDMTESALETARSYEDDGYDPDELANLLLSWYYAGYYTGSFSRQPPPQPSAYPG